MRSIGGGLEDMILPLEYGWHDPQCRDWLAIFQQRSRDAKPLRIEWLAADGLARPAIPVGSITLIAFLAMQVGVNPRTFNALILLGGLVRPRPIALAVPPETRERVRESGWGLRRGERFPKFVQGHLNSSSEMPGC
jgi:hypothetical protein